MLVGRVANARTQAADANARALAVAAQRPAGPGGPGRPLAHRACAAGLGCRFVALAPAQAAVARAVQRLRARAALGRASASRPGRPRAGGQGAVLHHFILASAGAEAAHARACEQLLGRVAAAWLGHPVCPRAVGTGRARLGHGVVAVARAKAAHTRAGESSRALATIRGARPCLPVGPHAVGTSRAGLGHGVAAVARAKAALALASQRSRAHAALGGT
mgnify:CR=1 FL=1